MSGFLSNVIFKKFLAWCHLNWRLLYLLSCDADMQWWRCFSWARNRRSLQEITDNQCHKNMDAGRDVEVCVVKSDGPGSKCPIYKIQKSRAFFHWYISFIIPTCFDFKVVTSWAHFFSQKILIVEPIGHEFHNLVVFKSHSRHTNTGLKMRALHCSNFINFPAFLFFFCSFIEWQHGLVTQHDLHRPCHPNNRSMSLEVVRYVS